MKNFWKRVGIGATVGLAFGIIAALSFTGVSKVINAFFPDKEKVTMQVASDDNDEIGKVAKQEKEDKPDKKHEVEATLTTLATKGDKVEETKNGRGMSVVELAKNNIPCVVSITNTSVSQVRDMWSGGIREYKNVSCGSGIIIGQTDEELLIATNCHVVSGAKSITAGFVDDEIIEATLKGSDADIDLAVIGVNLSDIKDETLDAIKVAVIGSSADLEVGEQVVAIGNAIGYGQSVTTGIVSALNRDIPDDGLDTEYIQTDAAINPGNSGGALFDMNGELIGINSAKIASTYVEGIGYAIPMDAAKPIIEGLMNRKTREKVDEKKAGYIGISGVTADESISEMYGIPEGIFLQVVEKDSPAEKAGLKKGDVIRKFDGVTVSSISELRSNLDYYEEGEVVDLLVYRFDDGEYKEKTISIKLGSREGTALDPDNADQKSDSAEDGSKDEESSDKEPKNDDSDRQVQDFYESLPKELQEFFNGFGR